MEVCPGVNEIINVMKKKQYKVFDSKGGYDLNLVGIRTSSIEANTFNDWITVFYTYDDKWNFFAFPATTDPGTYYRLNPMNVRGTAVLKPGQYRGAYKIGLHRGYKALEQKGAVTVFRDANRDQFLDTTGVIEDTGVFAINIHRSNAYRASLQVGKWSAGCQVLQDPDHFTFLLMLCERAKSKYGNSFTYTLLEEKDFS
jgi:hypothetical protein